MLDVREEKLSDEITERCVPAWFVGLTLGILYEWAEKARNLEAREEGLRNGLEWVRDFVDLDHKARKKVNRALHTTRIGDRHEPATLQSGQNGSSPHPEQAVVEEEPAGAAVGGG